MESREACQPYAKRFNDLKPFLLSAGLVASVVLLLVSCVSKSGDGSPKFKQYYVQGEQLYTVHCSNCHQKNGKGLGRVYPPLDTSDFMDANVDKVICLIRNGLDREIIVNNKSYNQAMPGFPSLSDLEIAQISTYIYNTWTHEEGMIDVKQVSKTLAECDSLLRQ